MNNKNNIWLLFYVLLFLGILPFIALSYLKYKDIKKEYFTKNEYLTEIVAKSTNSIFTQYDSILEVLGEQLMEHNNYKNSKRTAFLLDRLLKKDKSIAGLGLLDLKGNFISVSSNININKLVNLNKNEITKYSFNETINSNDLVVGRTYFVKGIGEWVLPLRKVILDEMGRPVAVMTIGVKIGDKEGLFSKISLEDGLTIVIVKDKDLNNKSYRVYYRSKNKKERDELYHKPIPKHMYVLITKEIYDKYGLSLKEIKNLSKAVSISTKDSFNKDKVAGLMYDKKYKIWIIIKSEVSTWFYSYMKTLLIYLSIFVLSFLVVFKLFKYIADTEKIKNKELVFLATHDKLTSLPNRNYLHENILKYTQKYDNKFEILFMDLDNFKNINDNFGHKVGDKILVEVSNRYKKFIKDSDLLVRYGGDEFILLMPKIDYKEKQNIMKRLINVISRPYIINKLEFNIGSSIGTASYPEDTNDFEELISIADIAMYEAKKTKNAYCVFSKKMKEDSRFKVEIEHQLRRAIQKDEMWMVYQPQINADGSLHGVEALVRWENEKLGFVPPDKFIKVAEETGLMMQIGSFIVSRALEDIKKIEQSFNESFQLSINISVRQLMEVDFLQILLSKLDKLEFDKSKLTLEITESIFIEDIDYILPLLQKIKDEGIKLSLDDFGTGYSSLSMLRVLPINELKIDKSFVDEILNNTEDAALVRSIISMGQDLNMSVLAEGTEDVKQVEKLKEFGCDVFQGYYFSKPISKDNLLEYVKRL